MAIFLMLFGITCIMGGCYYYKTQSKIYTIKVRGECIDSFVGKHVNINKFRYVIDGKEYEGTGRCVNTKREKKIYNLRVNKDDLEDFVTFPFMIKGIIFGPLFIIMSIIEFVLQFVDF